MESEEHDMPTETPPSPAEALKAISDVQARLADNWSRHTWGYDLTYSALVGLMIAGWGLPVPVAASCIAISLAGLAILAMRWKNRHGVWINSLEPGRARWAAVAIGLIMAGLGLANLWFMEHDGPHWGPAAFGAVAAVCALIASRVWRALYRGDKGLGA